MLPARAAVPGPPAHPASSTADTLTAPIQAPRANWERPAKWKRVLLFMMHLSRLSKPGTGCAGALSPSIRCGRARGWLQSAAHP